MGLTPLAPTLRQFSWRELPIGLAQEPFCQTKLSVLYKTTPRGGNEPVVVKFGNSPDGMWALGQEIRHAPTIASLNSPYLVRLLGTREPPLPWLARLLGTPRHVSPRREPGLVMEFLDGVNLNQKLAEYKRTRRLEDLILDIIEYLHGLKALHGANLLYRDVKPGNLILTGSRGKIVDFSLVAALDPKTRTLTPDSTAGTHMYMPPEAWLTLLNSRNSPGPISCTADLFGIAACLYRLISGDPPFPNVPKRLDFAEAQKIGEAYRSAPQSLLRIVYVPDRTQKGILERLDPVILRSLGYYTRGRHQSADEMIEALRGCLPGKPPPTDPEHPLPYEMAA